MQRGRERVTCNIQTITAPLQPNAPHSVYTVQCSLQCTVQCNNPLHCTALCAQCSLCNATISANCPAATQCTLCSVSVQTRSTNSLLCNMPFSCSCSVLLYCVIVGLYCNSLTTVFLIQTMAWCHNTAVTQQSL